MPHLDLETLQRYLAEQLAPAERTAAEAHLKACEPCREALEDERRFGKLLALDEPASVGGPALRDELVITVRGLDRRRDWQRRLGFVGVLALAGALGFNFGKLARRPAADPAVAQLPGVPASLQHRTIAHLAALQTLQAEPELVRELPYAAAVTRLLVERRPSGAIAP